MALPTDQQSSQVGTYEKILTIANRIMNGGEITKEEAIELIHSGRVKVTDLITHRLALAETGLGFQLVLKAEDSIKVIIEPWR